MSRVIQDCVQAAFPVLAEAPPLRYAGLSMNFRKEIGAHGVDTPLNRSNRLAETDALLGLRLHLPYGWEWLLGPLYGPEKIEYWVA